MGTMRFVWIGALATALLASTAAASEDLATVAKAFGTRAQIRQISLSPDGQQVAIVMPLPGAASAVTIANPIAGGSPARNAAAFKVPVLIFHGTEDRNVAIGQSQLMTDKLRGAGKQADLVIFKGLDHQLDDSDARTLMLTKSDEFLRANLGLKP